MLLITGGVWAGRTIWRIHHQLVTLDVRQMPLNEVLRKIEWQTWKKIRAEKALEARITFQVTDKPLSYVLDRLAEQAGARWSNLYAVYDSKRALQALDSALRGDGKLDRAGWTKVAPKLPDLKPCSGKAGPDFKFNAPPNAPGPMAGPGGPVMMVARRGNLVMQGGPNGPIETWSPEELLMESGLNKLMKNDPGQEATAKAAEEMSNRVKGRWTTYLAFRKSNLGIGFAARSPAKPGLGPGKHNPNDRFVRLTPEQRVQRARQWPSFHEYQYDTTLSPRNNSSLAG